MVPLAAMKVTVAVSLVMVGVCMILAVVTVPAVVVTPVPAVVPDKLSSMLPAMVPLVLTFVANFAEIAAPVITSINIVVLYGHQTESWFVRALMFSMDG